ncbi:hypothetical protein [Telluribacter sp. SYSU D00476]|uniref:hypothetical protein n=1 Tax=Telluribacter sp. SYSU D00476 TaxID=2811430 RepID=UPI001FF3148F|nr:hypothetical protein [Telluribacter sp. SYSU D00476]
MTNTPKKQSELKELNLLLVIREMGLEELVARYIHSQTGHRVEVADLPDEVFSAVITLREAIQRNQPESVDLWEEMLDKLIDTDEY